MPRSPDFFRQLNEQLLEQLEDYARQPGRTGEQVLEWLTQNGAKTSLRSVYRWLEDFRLEDRTRRASEVARHYLEVARDSDPNAVTEASIRKFEELVFDHLANTDQTDAGDLMKIAVAMKTGIGSRREIEELKKKQKDAVAAAEKTAESGTPKDVVNAMKEALGITA